MAENFYEDFASIYDDMMEDIDYEQVADFITRRIEGESKSVLEVACGTGNVTENLAYENFDITAFDISEEMIISAVNKMRKFRNVQFHVADMLNFEFGEIYDVCCCCCDGMNYVGREGIKNFFSRVYDHLKDGAWFIFDVSSVYKYKSMDKTYVYDKDDVFYVWENEIDKCDDVYGEEKISMEINFFVKNQDNDKSTDLKNESYRRITEIQTHYLHENEKILADLEETGFVNIETYDGYTENHLRDDSIRSTFTCRKPNK